MVLSNTVSNIQHEIFQNKILVGINKNKIIYSIAWEDKSGYFSVTSL